MSGGGSARRRNLRLDLFVRAQADRFVPTPVRRWLAGTMLSRAVRRVLVTPFRPEDAGDLVWGDIHIVLSMPKVGTLSLWDLLSEVKAGECAYWTHGLDVEAVAAGQALGSDRPAARATALQIVARTAKAAVSLEMRRDIRTRALADGRTPPPKPFVVTSVRDPLSRVLSLIFYATMVSRGVEAVEEIDRRAVLEMLAGERPMPFHEAWGPWWDMSPWFEQNIEGPFGVDVFAEPFDTARGWQIYESEHARILLIRQENFKQLPEAFAALYSMSPALVRSAKVNTAEDHGYGDHYRAVKTGLVVPELLVERAYGTRAVRHFYTDDEIRAFRARFGR